MEECAGILFRAKGQKYLLVLHAQENQWVQPGGHVEIGESIEDAAIREALEEVGEYPTGDLRFFRTSASNGIEFHCFIQDTEQFDPVIDSESLAAQWFTLDELPENTHPEVVKSIKIASGNELTIAKMIRDGELSSPQPYENLWLFDIRITGTGTSYRDYADEYVYRPPEVFLSDDFLERCNGLPLVFEHPEESILNTEEYRNRSIGNVVLPYIKNDEVWGIAKVLDADAAELMQKSHVSTSPAVVFRDAGSTETIELDGKTVLIEGDPSLLDHLAICEEGVWDKGGKPSGVNLNEDSTMADEKKADEMPAWADALSKKLDSVHERMDALEKSRKDGEEEGLSLDAVFSEKVEEEEREDSKEQAEEAGEREEEHEHEAEKQLELAEKEGEEEKREERGDARKDAKEEEERKDRKDAKREERMDSVKRENEDLKNRIAAMERALKPLSSADRDALSQAQARADGVAQLFGKQANPPLHGENPVAYRKRLAEALKKYSPEMKDVRMDSLSGSAFKLVEDKIYADAQIAALSPAEIPKGRLIPVVRRDAAGREITTFQGDMDAWMQHFKSPGNSCRILTPNMKN